MKQRKIFNKIFAILLAGSFSSALAVGTLSNVKNHREIMTKASINPEDLVDGWNYDEEDSLLVYYSSADPSLTYSLTNVYVRESDGEIDLTYTNDVDQNDTQQLTITGTFDDSTGTISGTVSLNPTDPGPTQVSLSKGNATVEYENALQEGWNYVEQDFVLVYFDGADITGYELSAIRMSQSYGNAYLTYTDPTGAYQNSEEIVISNASTQLVNGGTHLIGFCAEVDKYVSLNIGSIQPVNVEYWDYSSGMLIWMSINETRITGQSLVISNAIFHEFLEDSSFNYCVVTYSYTSGNDVITLPDLTYTSASYTELSDATAQGYEVTGICNELSSDSQTFNVDSLLINQDTIQNGWQYDPQYELIVYYLNNVYCQSYIIGTPEFKLYGTEENYVTFIVRADLPDNQGTEQETFTLTDATYLEPDDPGNNSQQYKVTGQWDDGTYVTFYTSELDVEFQTRWVYNSNNTNFEYWYDVNDIRTSKYTEIIFNEFGNGNLYNEVYLTLQALDSDGATVLRTDTLFIDQCVLQTDPLVSQDNSGVIFGKWENQNVEIHFNSNDCAFIKNEIVSGWNYINGRKQIIRIAEEEDTYASPGDRLDMEITKAKYFPGNRTIQVTYMLNNVNGETVLNNQKFTLQSAEIYSYPDGGLPGVIHGYAEELGINIMVDLTTPAIEESTDPYWVYDRQMSTLDFYFPDTTHISNSRTELVAAEYSPDTEEINLTYDIYYDYDGEPQGPDGGFITLTQASIIRLPDLDNSDPELTSGIIAGYCEEVDGQVRLTIDVELVGNGTPGWRYVDQTLSWVNEFGYTYEGTSIQSITFNTTSETAVVDIYFEELDDTKHLQLENASYQDLADQQAQVRYFVEGYNYDLTDEVFQFYTDNLYTIDGVPHWEYNADFYDLEFVDPAYSDARYVLVSCSYIPDESLIFLLYYVYDNMSDFEAYEEVTLQLTDASVLDYGDTVEKIPAVITGTASFIDGEPTIELHINVEIETSTSPEDFNEGWNFIDNLLIWYDKDMGFCDTEVNTVTLYRTVEFNQIEYAEVKYAIYGLNRIDPDEITYKTVILTDVEVLFYPNIEEQVPGILAGFFSTLNTRVEVEAFEFIEKELNAEATTITPEQAEQIVEYMPEITPETPEEEERQERNNESLNQLSEKTAAEILSAVSSSQSQISEERDRKIAEATSEEEVAQAEQEYQEKREIIETVTEASVVVGAGQQTAHKEGSAVTNALPEDSGLDHMGDTFNEFYQTQMDYLLGRKKAPEKRSILRDPPIQATSGVDLTISKEDYAKMIDFVDTAVLNMKNAALQIRKCSSSQMKLVVKDYIQVVKISSFREYDKEAADAEFVEQAYKAIMLNMQQQVIEALKREHKPSNNVDRELLYKQQLEACENYETFEEIVLEVLRLKYVSLTNEEIDIDDFRTIYDSIFRSWILDDASLNETNISLEELTKATIETTTSKANKFTIRTDLTKQESSVLIVIGVVFGVSAVAGLTVPFILKRRKLGKELAK